jgi:sarcosine oxidase delta subunit
MINVKCPFCGGQLRFECRHDYWDEIHTEVSCNRCNVNFSHTQQFYFTNDNNRVSANPSFEEVFGGNKNEN